MRSPHCGGVKLVEFLQGKWLGHPLHPAIVHVPIGAWITACALDLVACVGATNTSTAKVALWCVGAGLVTALLAVGPGVADWSSIKKGKPAWKIGLWHMALNIVAALVWAGNFGLRWTHRGDVGVTSAVLVTSLIGTALVFVSGWLGSLMVFDQGIGVARMSKKKWRAIAIRGGARVPEEG
jgi:uncharacterized membrane protein